MSSTWGFIVMVSGYVRCFLQFSFATGDDWCFGSRVLLCLFCLFPCNTHHRFCTKLDCNEVGVSQCGSQALQPPAKPVRMHVRTQFRGKSYGGYNYVVMVAVAGYLHGMDSL